MEKQIEQNEITVEINCKVENKITAIKTNYVESKKRIKI